MKFFIKNVLLLVLVLGQQITVEAHGHDRLVKKAAKQCVAADFAWEDYRSCIRERGSQHKWCVSYKKTAAKKSAKCQTTRDKLHDLALKRKKELENKKREESN